MELKLNIYNKDRSIAKTYVKEDYDVMYGVVDDLLEVLDMEVLINGKSTDDLIGAVSRLLRARKDIVHPLLMDIFDGLTVEEIRCAKVVEIVEVIIGLTGFSFEQLKMLAFRKRQR